MGTAHPNHPMVTVCPYAGTVKKWTAASGIQTSQLMHAAQLFTAEINMRRSTIREDVNHMFRPRDMVGNSAVKPIYIASGLGGCYLLGSLL